MKTRQDPTYDSVNAFLTNSLQPTDPKYQTSDDIIGEMQDAAIGTAKIRNLIASKILAGTITSQSIYLAVVDGKGDVFIAAGKTDFDNTEDGFILGLDDSDGNKAKFYIGNILNYFNWDGSNLLINGGTVQTGASGQRVVMANDMLSSHDASGALRMTLDNKTLTFYETDGVTVAGTITVPDSGNIDMVISPEVGRSVRIRGDFIVEGVTTRPDVDNTSTLGNASFRWTEVWAVNGAIQTSDVRNKRDIRAMNEGLAVIEKLKPKSFKMNDEEKIRHGMIAQEVRQILPELVYGNNEDGYGLNYADFVPFLIKGMQELSEKVAQLELQLQQVKK